MTEASIIQIFSAAELQVLCEKLDCTLPVDIQLLQASSTEKEQAFFRLCDEGMCLVVGEQWVIDQTLAFWLEAWACSKGSIVATNCTKQLAFFELETFWTVVLCSQNRLCQMIPFQSEKKAWEQWQTWNEHYFTKPYCLCRKGSLQNTDNPNPPKQEGGDSSGNHFDRA